MNIYIYIYKNLKNRDGIWHRKMRDASNEKRQTTPYGRNGTPKSRKNQNVQRKGNLHIHGILEDDTTKQHEMKKKKIRVSPKNQKATRDKTIL